MKNALLHFTVVFGLLFTLGAQTPSVQRSAPLAEAKPESVGMSSTRLAHIDRMAEAVIENGAVPGVAAIVVRDGKIVYHKAFGMADNAQGRKLKKDDIFRIASQSKAITATAVMMLWEEGRFRLDDPIAKFIPEFANPKILKSYKFSNNTYTTEPAEKEITIRQLLTHTSGLGYGLIDSEESFRMIYKEAGIVDLFTTEPVTIGESVRKLGKLPLHFEPGERWNYSEGLDVLGYLIEVVSGLTFDEFLQTRLFKPLGMNDTGFYLPDDKADRLVTVQMPKDGKWIKYTGTEGYYDADYPIKGAKTFYSGGAGMVSTAKDYATFLQLYLNGGELNGVRILSRTTVDTIMSRQVDFPNDADAYYGLAFSVLTEAGQAKGGKGSAGTFSWGGYFNSQYFADPNEKIIGVILKQVRHAQGDDSGVLFPQLVFQAVDN